MYLSAYLLIAEWVSHDLQQTLADLLHFISEDLRSVATCVADDKVALIPGRVISQVQSQHGVHIVQFPFPQTIHLHQHTVFTIKLSLPPDLYGPLPMLPSIVILAIL